MNFDNGRPLVSEILKDTTIEDIMGDEDKIYVPTLKELLVKLKKISLDFALFSEIPIGCGAYVVLTCTDLTYDVLASSDPDEIETPRDRYESCDEVYLADTDAELRATAHRMLTFVNDSIETDRAHCRGAFAG